MSILPKTVGLPKMGKEKRETRVFLPEFVNLLVKLGATVYLEEGYGASGGYTLADYQTGNYQRIQICSREEAFQKDVVMVLRAPERQEFDLLRPGSILVSMLHYPTRPWRVQRLQELGVRAISLDAVANDEGIRLVENMRAVAWNGLEVAFDVLEQQLSFLRRPDGLPVQVLILGAGLVGKYAVEAATKLGSLDRFQHYLKEGAGAVALTAGRSVTSRPDLVETLFRQTDILVDATARRDPSQPVVRNEWLAWLPERTVVTDLAVDPYLPDDNPPVVRGIEGVPMGNLNQYIFRPDDAHWRQTIPSHIPTTHRRTTVSCYSWPGIHPDACMAHYGRQLVPLMEVLLEKGYNDLSTQGRYFERALARATLRAWIQETSLAAN